MMDVLICDDIEEHRIWMLNSLLIGHHSYVGRDENDVWDNFFNVHIFSIVGKAIDAINSGLNVDVALVDSDFNRLNVTLVKNEGYDPNVEMTATRGFDLVNKLEQLEIPYYLFTGHYGNSPEIRDVIRKRKLALEREYNIKPDKGYAGNQLKENMPELLRRAGKRVFDGIDAHTKGILSNLMEPKYRKILLTLPIQVGIKDMTISDLVYGFGEFIDGEDPGSVTFQISDHLSAIKELLQGGKTFSIQLKGIWSGKKTKLKDYGYMLKAINAYRDHRDFDIWELELHNLLVEFVTQFVVTVQRNDIVWPPGLRMRNSNCKNQLESVTIEDNNFLLKFREGLLCRRIFAYLSYVQSKSKLLPNRGDLVELVAQAMGRKTDNLGNVRQYVTEVLGLRAELDGYLPQTISISKGDLIDFETEWINEKGEAVTLQISNNNL